MGKRAINTKLYGRDFHQVFRLASTLFILMVFLNPSSVSGTVSAPTRRVNVPYWPTGEPEPSRAVFWFGKVDPTNNYADVRAIYDDEKLWVTVHIIDRLLRYDETPSLSDITEWDAVALYLDLGGNIGNLPNSNAYHFIIQLSDYHVSFRGDGSGWAEEQIPFSIITGWRGDGGMNDDLWDKGWVADFIIPFTSLGLSEAPPFDTTWGMAVVVHDRDDDRGLMIPDQVWPETMDADIPATWGQIHFGVPGYNPPLALPESVVTIREGLNGVSVKDAAVGGHTVCGDPYGPDYWPGWGSANYSGYDQINIQNEWDIADWPCFSKYFVTFPLDPLPTGQVILSATLSMHLFGNAGGGEWGESPDSYIQVLTVGKDWDETTLTWNNAPLALENISGTWVHPRDYDLPDPAYSWDVSRAVADAYAKKEPLRLALYSADGDYHTGKYFWSSDAGAWNADARPTVSVALGNSCNALDVECYFTYLPLSQR